MVELLVVRRVSTPLPARERSIARIVQSATWRSSSAPFSQPGHT